MNILSKLKSIARNKVMLGAAVGILLGAGVLMGTTGAASAETYNCDSNAVMYCGAPSVSKLISNYNNGISGHETPNSIHDVYSYFGISSSDVKSMTSTVQMGIVKKNGQVYVGSKLVASSALTAGRSYISGSKTVHYGVTTFYTRAPSVSFLDDSLDAYVVMVNNQFKFAILVSCGNPVTGVPTPTPITPKPVLTPKYTINKLVAVQGSSNYSKDVSVKSGAIVDYKITVASTGNTPVTNLNVSDKLPADVEYVGGTLQEDGKAANSNDLFNSHIAVGTLKNGTSTVFTFEAKVGYEDTTATCKTATLTNSANMVATGLGATSSSANVEKACQPAPTPCYQCTSLTADQTAANAYNFTAKASASNGATITGYVFNYGDGKTQTVTTSNDSATASHAYSTTATFNVTVAALVSVNGKTQTVTSANCGTTVKPVCPKTVTPVYECTSLENDQTSADSFTFTAKASASNGATITGYVFNYGDGKTQTVSTSATSANASHTYSTSGTYNVTVAALVSVNGKTQTVTSANCGTTVKPVCPKTVTPVYACNDLTADQTAANAYNFTAKASASNGATITGYVFNYGDGKTQTVTTSNDSATASHAYSTTATFNVTVAALVSVNGKTQTVTSANCGTTVKPVCPLPEGQCTDVKLVQNAGNPREVTATATYTTVNGATLTGVSFNWGDSTVTPASAQTAATHTYQADGNYTVVATLTFSSPSATVASANCQAPITITTVTPTCDELDVNVNNTSMTVTVTNLQYTANNGTYENTTLDWGDGSTPVTAANVNGQTHTYTANGPFTIVATANFSVNGTDTPVTSTTCQQTVSFTQTPVTPVTPATPTTTTPAPTELVSTGAGNVVGLFIAAMIVGVVGYYFYMNRRLSREG